MRKDGIGGKESQKIRELQEKARLFEDESRGEKG
jgi:hypothetical protein